MIDMNLQLFNEEGFEEVAEPQESFDTPSDDLGLGDEQPTEQPQEVDFTPLLEQLSSQMKYNGEPVQVNSIEDLIAGYQKSLNYDKIYDSRNTLQEQLNQVNPDVEFAQMLAQKYGFNSVSDYRKAVEETWKQEEINRLVEQNMPKEMAEEYLESKRFREEYSQEKQAKEQEEAQRKKDIEFLDWYDGMHTKGVFKDAFDAKAIPQSVLEQYAQGVDLKTAYMEHALLNQRESLQQETLQNIAKNKATSPESVTNTTTERGNMSVDQVNQLLNGMDSSERNKWISVNMDNLEKWGYFKNF